MRLTDSHGEAVVAAVCCESPGSTSGSSSAASADAPPILYQMYAREAVHFVATTMLPCMEHFRRLAASNQTLYDARQLAALALLRSPS